MTYLRDHRGVLDCIGLHFILAVVVRKVIYPFQGRIVTAGNSILTRERMI
ncbi:MAG: hypothetical protein WCS70_12250 [Verrucomicrobiota bacterium]